MRFASSIRGRSRQRVVNRCEAARAQGSQPSLVESLLWDRPIETVAANILKFPGRVERWLRNSPKDYLWSWVGGWELFLTKA